MVFVGCVESVTPDTTTVTIGDRTHTFELHRYRFRVKAVWKGQLQDQVEITTSAMGSACGSKFDRNTDYIVYASEHDGELGTSLCAVNPSLRIAFFDLFEFGRPTIIDSTFEWCPVTVDDLFEAAISGDRRTRSAARVGLGMTRNDRPLIVDRLLKMLDGDDANERLAAVEAFRHMGSEGKIAQDGIERAFESENEELRIGAFYSLIGVGGRQYLFPYLMTAIESDSYDLKCAALNQASCMRGCLSSDEQKMLYRELSGLIEYPDRYIRTSAMKGLMSCGDLSVDALPVLDYISSSGQTYQDQKTAEHVAMQIRREYAKEER